MNLTREEFLQLPAAHPPPDVKVNFENPPNIRGYSFPLFLVVVFLTNGVFLAKLWVQLRIAKKMLVEDWVLTVAWVIYAGVFCTFAGLICDLPVGMHQWDMNMAKLMRHLFVRRNLASNSVSQRTTKACGLRTDLLTVIQLRMDCVRRPYDLD